MFIIEIYNEVLFRPILNLLVAVYNILPWPDLGIAIIIVTIIVRFLLFPLAQKSLKSQKSLQELQPKIEAIKKEHKDDKNLQNQKVMEFYKENKINPFGSCLPLLLQLPIIFALYKVFSVGTSAENLDQLYSFVARPEVINTMFLGIVDLTQVNIYLAFLAGIFQFAQSKMIAPKTKKSNKKGSSMADMSSIFSKQMIYFMPVITVFIGMSLPAGLTLYWVVATLFAVGQQYILTRKDKKEKNA
ncbi:YidC/Oxa1 family membrane protein insertase [Patescibacteria group bacterium]|nr:YidC/Oxa1 family membrane protein insertase [Patescibacteria group bacterium]